MDPAKGGTPNPDRVNAELRNCVSFCLAGGGALFNYLCVHCVRTMTQRASPHSNDPSLTRLCVGRDEDRPARHLAWAGSVCALFLVVGIAGFGLPPFRESEPKLRGQIVPVVFTAPGQPAPAKLSPAVSPTAAPEESAPMPDVARVADIPGLVVLAVPLDALRAAAPVAQADAVVAPEFTRFNPTTGTNTLPQPSYPDIARRRGHQGTVRVYFTVAPSGEVVKAEVGRSSGYNVLDAAAVEAVRNHKGFGPGGLRHHFQEITFQLK